MSEVYHSRTEGFVKRTTPALVLLLATAIFAQGQGAPHYADELLRACEANPMRTACEWYLKGFIDGININPGSNRIQTSCLPETFSLDQVRRVIVKSFSEHPEKLHLGIARAVRDSLAEACPCKK